MGSISGNYGSEHINTFNLRQINSTQIQTVNKFTTPTPPLTPPPSRKNSSTNPAQVGDKLRLAASSEKKDGFIKTIANGFLKGIGMGLYGIGIGLCVVVPAFATMIGAIGGGPAGAAIGLLKGVVVGSLGGSVIGKIGTTLMSAGGMKKEDVAERDKALNKIATWPIQLLKAAAEKVGLLKEKEPVNEAYLNSSQETKTHQNPSNRHHSDGFSQAMTAAVADPVIAGGFFSGVGSFLASFL